VWGKVRSSDPPTNCREKIADRIVWLTDPGPNGQAPQADPKSAAWDEVTKNTIQSRRRFILAASKQVGNQQMAFSPSTHAAHSSNTRSSGRSLMCAQRELSRRDLARVADVPKRIRTVAPTPRQTPRDAPQVGALVIRWLSTLRRFAALEGLRGIAAFAILGFHFANVNGQPSGTVGFARHLEVGVPVFFVLSGFVLYRPWLLAHSEGLKPPSIQRYARRRMARIVPAYWVALTVAVTLGLSTGPIGHAPLVYYGFLQTYSVRTVFNGLSPAWSLCVEMSFYAVLPVLAYGIARWGGSLRRQGLIAAFLILAVIGVRAAALSDARALCATLLGTFDWFVVGMLLATVSVVRPSAFRRVSPAGCFIAAAAVLVTVSALGLPSGIMGAPGLPMASWLGDHVAYTLIAGLMVMGAVAAEDRHGLVPALLKSRGGQLLGQISYGVFLWHVPMIFATGRVVAHGWWPNVWAAKLLLTVTLALVAAAVSWYGLERHVLRARFVVGGRRKRLDTPAAETT
jgi:peptidoglycan/LPS O-acetylase OafA/YrhL